MVAAWKFVSSCGESGQCDRPLGAMLPSVLFSCPFVFLTLLTCFREENQEDFRLLRLVFPWLISRELWLVIEWSLALPLVGGVLSAPTLLSLFPLGRIIWAVREVVLALPASVPGRRAPSKKTTTSLLIPPGGLWGVRPCPSCYAT